jgi:hypothetical protein
VEGTFFLGIRYSNIQRQKLRFAEAKAMPVKRQEKVAFTCTACYVDSLQRVISTITNLAVFAPDFFD